MSAINNTERLSKCYSSVIHDIMRDDGYKDFTLPPNIKPCKNHHVLAGQIFTMEGEVDKSLSHHETLLAWTGFLSKAPNDKVVICQPHNNEVALMGELSAETLQQKGVKGYIVDGGARDLDFILKIDFPVWSSFYTPRDIVQLLVTLVFGPDKENLQGKGLVRTIYDPCCGTGGLLSIGKQWEKENINSDISIELFGQELNDQTYAICKSDLLISGENPENIYGPNLSTLTKDQLKDNKFDYIIANPPYGVSWKKEADKIKEEAKDPGGRFSVGLPSVSDGSFLFLMHMISKMNPKGSRVGVVFNASPMFQGKAGQGPSEIRKYLLENDLIEAIIQLPDRLFFNTGITTYIWIINNNKRNERREKIQLIDASNYFKNIKIKLGEKSKEISYDQIQDIYKTFIDFKEKENSKIFSNKYFGYTEITINSPLKDKGSIVYDSKGVPKKDKNLVSKDRVPLNREVEEYFDAEIKPFNPESWVEDSGNKIGYEIAFMKEFYSYSKFRDISSIEMELKNLESELKKLNDELY